MRREKSLGLSSSDVGKVHGVGVDFSSLPRASVLGRVLRGLLRLLPTGLVVPVLQGTLRGARWTVGASTHGCWLGSYESSKQWRFASLLTAGGVVLDVGANVGFYTVLAARCVGAHGRVVAIEPNERNVAFLRRHVVLNNCRQVEVVAAAAGREDGSISFTRGTDPSMGHVSAHGSEIVVLRSLDSLKQELRLPAIEMVKIDVEGAEIDVLEGAAMILANDRPTILLATHGVEVSRRCRERLHQAGYTVEPLDEGVSADEADEFIAVPRGAVA